MRPFRYACAALLLLAVQAFAIEIKLPATVKGAPGEFVTVKACTTGKVVKWVALDKGVALFPQDLLKDTKTAVLTAPEEGKYRLLAYTSDDKGPSDPAYVTVEIAKPVPPPPPDTLAEDILAAFKADAGTDKAADIASLAALYRNAGKILDDPAVTTLGALQAKLQAARRVLVPDDHLVGVRKVVNAELAKLGTSASAPLDDTLKAKAKAQFDRIAKALVQKEGK